MVVINDIFRRNSFVIYLIVIYICIFIMFCCLVYDLLYNTAYENNVNIDWSRYWVHLTPIESAHYNICISAGFTAWYCLLQLIVECTGKDKSPLEKFFFDDVSTVLILLYYFLFEIV